MREVPTFLFIACSMVGLVGKVKPIHLDNSIENTNDVYSVLCLFQVGLILSMIISNKAFIFIDENVTRHYRLQ